MSKSEPSSSQDIEKGGPPDKHDPLSRYPTSASTASSSSTSVVSRLSLSHQRTAPPRDYDAHDRVVLERLRTATSIYEATVGNDLDKPRSGSVFGPVFSRITSRLPAEEWPEFGGGKGYPPLLPDQASYVVDFTGPDDPMHGQNWPLKKKLITAMVLGFTTFVAAWGSSIFSSATSAVSLHFGVSTEVSILGMSLYVLGFAFGPLIWAPFSELKGRKKPILLGIFGFSIFQVAVAVAKDIQTVLIARFFGGVFASCPVTLVGAVFADLFAQETRGTAVAMFSMAVFSGPLFGPIAGGFILQNQDLGWRWTEYITALMGFLALGLCLLFLEETYPPVILIEKAAHLRRITKNWGIHAKQEEVSVDLPTLLVKNFTRPIKLLFAEPIIFLISIYTAFVYSILYLFLVSYPIVFAQVRGWKGGLATLPFIGMVLGMVMGGGLVIAFQPWTTRRANAAGHVLPEDRLVPCIIGSIFFPIGLFWFSWTGADPNIHWIVPTLGGVPFGFGIIIIFLQCLNYLIDAYLNFAASAIAANTILRSALAAGFPLFGRFMFEPKPEGALGVGWAGSLLAFLAVAMIPIPVYFFLNGAAIRKKSKWAPTDK
ncbi:major facilitator superfamily domain-containing protein [Tricharina praecox]|uniref:major facilitator superfamily domain-containing protein n=1 Tax=Tricharina praecox TaxID=43433 RepID=UPI002220256A|nr:major facilitator superfamily domain-containing protein [Tricharina praecox]KAI5844157.1 major facilitator superfamily domain-containing protein [Tricharina praecox]